MNFELMKDLASLNLNKINADVIDKFVGGEQNMMIKSWEACYSTLWRYFIFIFKLRLPLGSQISQFRLLMPICSMRDLKLKIILSFCFLRVI